MSEFIIPNLGDGVAQGDVLKVLVKVGDTLKVDQSVLELETDKATIEVPSDVAGTVKEIKVKAGDKVKARPEPFLSLDGARREWRSQPLRGEGRAPKAGSAAAGSCSRGCTARHRSGACRARGAGLQHLRNRRRRCIQLPAAAHRRSPQRPLRRRPSHPRRQRHQCAAWLARSASTSRRFPARVPADASRKTM